MSGPPNARVIPLERRLAAEHATAAALAECATLADAAPRILQAICDLLGWEHGALWMVDAKRDRLRCLDVWHGTAGAFPEFKEASRQTAFERGVGLPGRVWATAEPAWIPDVVHDRNFPRAAIAAREGLHAALGFPILGRGQVLGILEFFSREIREPDAGLLQMLGTIGSQIGLVVERLRAQEELDRFFNLSRDLFCIAGFDGYFKRLNPMWTKVLGYDRTELVSRPYVELLHPDDREKTVAEAEKIEQGETTLSFENRYSAKDGSYRWLQWTATPYPGEQTIYAVARDVTERKVTEAQLEATRRQLQQNAENLAQLVKELEVSRHQAVEATLAKGEFLANMSHEIRTPLTAIIGMTDLALGTRLTAEQRGYLETVKASSDSLLTIVNDVLDFSKIEARRLELEHVAFGLRDTVEDALRLMALRAEEKKLELAGHIDRAAPDALVGDPGRLRQVIVNLVGNAIKFTQRGEVVLNASVVSSTDDRVQLRVSVRDTGIGVPPELHRTIFAAFAQADSSTTRRYGGTGLGLAISAQLVQMMGGEIGLESEVGRGSTFHFTAEFERAAGVSREPTGDAAAIHGLRVLVIDDNATNRFIIGEMLGSWHMRVDAVAGGAAGLEALAQAHETHHPFAVVVVDGQMPEMDGFEVARRIRSDRRFDGVRIIMLTSMGRPGDVTRSRKTGVAAYLTKPVKHSDLLDAIVTLFGAAGAERAPAPRSRGPERKLRILLAEDNAVNRRLVRSIMRKRGHELLAVEDGRRAVRAVTRAKRPYDLVLMDVQMPEMGGIEATAAIRQHERTAGGHVPIVAMTAHAMSGDREHCLRAGMDGYLSKPVRADELIDTVERHAAAGRNPDAATGSAAAPVAASEGLELEVALTHVNGDRRLLREIARLFLADSPRTLATLRRAVRAGDAAGTRAAAHALKGSIAIFGAPQAAAHAMELQRMGDTGDLAAAPSALLALESHVAALHRDLTALAGTKPDTRSRTRPRGATKRPPRIRKTAKRKR